MCMLISYDGVFSVHKHEHMSLMNCVFDIESPLKFSGVLVQFLDLNSIMSRAHAGLKLEWRGMRFENLGLGFKIVYTQT